jgi:hypothetical protein
MSPRLMRAAIDTIREQEWIVTRNQTSINNTSYIHVQKGSEKKVIRLSDHFRRERDVFNIATLDLIVRNDADKPYMTSMIRRHLNSREMRRRHRIKGK